MPKTKKGVGIVEEVLKLQEQMEAMRSDNPDNPAISPLETKIMKMRETAEFQNALEEEERRMGEELKKLFQA